MALFSGNRDVSLFRHLNKELINDIIDTEIYYYKMVIADSKIDLYGESSEKVFYNPVKIPALISRNDRDNKFEDFGRDYDRTTNFAFLRDTLVDLDIYTEVGDVIQWDNEYYIIDTVRDDQLFAGKNPETWDGGHTHGYNVSVICETHVTKQTVIKLVDNYRVGNNKDNDDLRIDR
jgi:hypothetical protein